MRTDSTAVCHRAAASGLLALALVITGCTASPPPDAAATSEAASEPSSSPAQLDLTGEWSWHDAPDPGQTMTATITTDRIEIHWPSFEVGEDGDPVSGTMESPLYWAGSFTSPAPGEKDYTFTSAADTAAMEKSPLSSSETEKEFRFSGGVFSFEISVQGETRTLTLERD